MQNHWDLPHRARFVKRGRVGAVFLFLLWVCHAGVAAEPVQTASPLPAKRLSMREAVLLALRYNPSIQSQELQRVVDKFALRVAENNFELQYALTASGQYGRSITNNISIYSSGTQVTQTTTLNNSLGTQFSAQVNNLTSTQGINTTNVTLSVTQPLMQGFGEEVTLAGIRNARDSEFLSRLNLKNTTAQAITIIISDYRQVVAAVNQLKIQRLTLENDSKTYRQLELQIKSGQRAPAEAVQSKAAIAQDNLSIKQSENLLAQAKQTLLNDIGLNPCTPIDVMSDIDTQNLKVPLLEEAMQVGLANNFAYQASLIQQGQNRRNLVVAKDQERTSLNLTLSNTLGDGQGLNMSNLNGSNDSQQNVQVEVSVPIRNFAKKQAVLQAKVAIEQQEVAIAQSRRNLETQVINAITNLKLLKQQVELAKQARDLAKRNLEISKIKLSYGRVTMFEVSNLQNSLTSSELAVVSNQINYLNALSQLQFLIGTTLNTWDIQLRDK
ncbi:MAG: TolC family protein [Gammaproteobacteria bacterium]|nr:TolC family protein [Gammaproteobacteria bacterium]